MAWADTFGEFSAGNVQYYLATAFDEIWLQPSGDLGLTGIAVERVYLRGALDKLGADFQVAKRHEFKSAAEQLTERGFSEPARQATQQLTASITEQLVAAIADRRDIPADKVRGLIDAGPFLATQALAHRLVDQLGYRDEVYAAVRKHAGPDAVLQFLGRYQRGKALGGAGPQGSQESGRGPARPGRRADLRHRPDPARPQRPESARRLDGLGHHRARDPDRRQG